MHIKINDYVILAIYHYDEWTHNSANLRRRYIILSETNNKEVMIMHVCRGILVQHD